MAVGRRCSEYLLTALDARTLHCCRRRRPRRPLCAVGCREGAAGPSHPANAEHVSSIATDRIQRVEHKPASARTNAARCSDVYSSRSRRRRWLHRNRADTRPNHRRLQVKPIKRVKHRTDKTISPKWSQAAPKLLENSNDSFHIIELNGARWIYLTLSFFFSESRAQLE